MIPTITHYFSPSSPRGAGTHQPILSKMKLFAESPEWLEEEEVQGQFYGFVTGVANLTCQAEAEPPPTFRWLDAENNPVSSGNIVSEEYKVVYILYSYK